MYIKPVNVYMKGMRNSSPTGTVTLTTILFVMSQFVMKFLFLSCHVRLWYCMPVRRLRNELNEFHLFVSPLFFELSVFVLNI